MRPFVMSGLRLPCRLTAQNLVRRSGAAAILLTALASVLAAAEPASSVGPLMKLYQSGRLPAERQPAVVEMICNRGNAHDLRVVFDRILQPDGMDPALRLKAIGWHSPWNCCRRRSTTSIRACGWRPSGH